MFCVFKKKRLSYESRFHLFDFGDKWRMAPSTPALLFFSLLSSLSATVVPHWRRVSGAFYSLFSLFSFLFSPYSLLFALYSLLFTLCSLLFALCSLLFTLCSLLFALCSLLFAPLIDKLL